jgi:hypothetical protein
VGLSTDLRSIVLANCQNVAPTVFPIWQNVHGPPVASHGSDLCGSNNSHGDFQMNERRFVSKIRERQKLEAKENKKRARAVRKNEEMLAAALLAAQDNHRPHTEDLADFDVLDVVDPVEDAKLERIGRGEPMISRGKAKEVRKRVISLRDDTVGRMAKRGELGDANQRAVRLRAARLYEGTCERTQIGKMKSCSPSVDLVDYAYFDVDTDASLAAQKLLAELDRIVGMEDVVIVRAVLMRKCEISQIAAERGLVTTSRDGRCQKRLLRQRFLESLDRIANHAGFKERPADGRMVRDIHRTMADAVAMSPELHRAIQRARID